MHLIFVTGGVVSGLGKGISTSSIAKVLKMKGFSATVMKIDPYINFDAGTLRPSEHGEVWVTEDGGETDQDLGNYERFTDTTLGKKHNVTTGQVFSTVIERERKGEYLGKTVQPIPHITDEIKKRIIDVADSTKADFVLIEIGGVVGDYENILFLETARQMKLENIPVVFVHVAYLPFLEKLGEIKSKPVQHSTRELLSLGIQPDFIICRSAMPIDDVRKEKIGLFCNIAKQNIIDNPDIGNIYELPLFFEEQDFGNKILKKFNIDAKPSDDIEWKNFVNILNNVDKTIKIGIVGKYFDIGGYKLLDSYVSVIEAVRHACAENQVSPDIRWIDSKDFEKYPSRLDDLKQLDGIIIPGGFGGSGVEGKISAIQYARENNIPYLGLCYGMQLAVIEFARNVCKLENAHSTEILPDCKNPVVDILPWQKEIIAKQNYGATMRLGGQIVKIKPGTLAYATYNKGNVIERFRHRYEINPDYVNILEKYGLIFSGSTPDETIKQIAELPGHKFFIASQFHPEFTSRPLKPNPLFDGFVKACIDLVR
ncbi:MAG: CTP synthase [Candidatus Aenigmarchaeota archaeon]|nr:CTP synthase [Candidatus Aenigmarchaeota archaeon]